MDLIVRNSKFEVVHILDVFETLIWTDRYDSYGDFEISTKVDANIINNIKRKYYLESSGSDSTMIVEDLVIDDDVENGSKLTISGRSLESILDRRIIWGMRSYNGNFQTCIETLLNENVISPSIADRKISNFVFQRSTDPAVTSLTIDKQWTGDNLYDVIVEECQIRNLGFKVILDDQNRFVFSLYSGVDRSYDQTDNPYVIFSNKFENLINASYLESDQIYKNVTLIAGQGEGSARAYTTYGSGSGLERRELFTDARDISKTKSDNTEYTTAEYNKLLQARGEANMLEYEELSSFTGNLEKTNAYEYRKDYDMGDIVQVSSAYGFEGKTRIIEMIQTYDQNGYSMYPAFSMIDD